MKFAVSYKRVWTYIMILVNFGISGQTIIPNLFVNTGHGSKGWTLTFGSIKLLADIISENKPEVVVPILKNYYI